MFKQIFDQKRSTKKKIYIYITKTSQKQFGRKFNYIGLLNIFSIIFKMLNVVIFTKKKHLLVLIHCKLRNPQVIVIQKIKHLCNFCFNTCLTVFVVLNSLRLFRHLWLHRDNYIVLINQGNKLRYKVNNMF